MSEGIVKLFKAVQVKINYANRLITAVLVYVIIKASAVIKTRKEIRIIAVNDLSFQIFRVGNVPVNAYFSNGIIKYITDDLLIRN